jgi:hypothetical protein
VDIGKDTEQLINLAKSGPKDSGQSADLSADGREDSQQSVDSSADNRENSQQSVDSPKDNPDTETLAQKLNIPSRLELSATSERGDVTVNAQAEVVVPNVDAMPVIRVKKRGFTQEEADKIIEHFIGDKVFNDRIVPGYSDPDVENLFYFKTFLPIETDPEIRARWQKYIDELESAGVTIGEMEPIKPAAKIFTPHSNGIFAPYNDIEGYSSDSENKYYLKIENNPDANRFQAFYTKEKEGYARSFGLYGYEWGAYVEKLGLNPSEVPSPLLLSKAEAEQQAVDVLTAFGLDEMALFSCEEVWGANFPSLPFSAIESTSLTQSHHAYQLEYVREVNGVPITRADNDITPNSYIKSDDGDEEIAQWPYERVHFIIDDSGIIEFVWQSPYEVIETITASSSLKPFAEIESIFSKMIYVVNAYQGSADDVKFTLDISRAQLGLTRIAEKNQSDTYLIVPCWDFFGTSLMEYTTQANKTQSYEGPLGATPNYFSSKLTINAIDGSIINRHLGY